MDIFTHFLWFFVLTWNKYFAKGKKFFNIKWDKTAGFFFAFAPDIALLPYLFFVGLNLLNGNSHAGAKLSVPLWTYQFYQFFHSYIFWAVMALILYFLARRFFMPFLLGYGLHITIDLFIHRDLFANRPLSPLLPVMINGFFEWDQFWYFTVINVAILACVFFWFWWKKDLTWKKFWEEVF